MLVAPSAYARTHTSRFTFVPDVRDAAASTGAPTGGAGFILQPISTTHKAANATTTSKSARTLELGQRVLKQGMKGNDVSELQGYLTLAGVPTAVDGDFGPLTKQSVIAFEQQHSLTADGIASAAVVQALRTAIAAGQSSAPAGKAVINPDGTATAPAGAPAPVQAMIAAANQIIDKPYAVGGGHGKWNDSAYDCSGAVSFALHGAGLLASSEDSTGLESYGSAGPGKWVTVYADASHTWIVIAGIAFDTADFGGPNIPAGSGPRWRTNPIGNLADGGSYVVRHPPGL